MILKMNQDTYGNLLWCQESPGMTFDTTRLHKTAFQEVNFLTISKNLLELWLCSTLCVLIQDLGWTQLESTSKIIIVNVENSSFGYDLIIGNLLLEDPLISKLGVLILRMRGGAKHSPLWDRTGEHQKSARNNEKQ